MGDLDRGYVTRGIYWEFRLWLTYLSVQEFQCTLGILSSARFLPSTADIPQKPIFGPPRSFFGWGEYRALNDCQFHDGICFICL